MVEHCQALNRSVQVVNLDPAAEHFEYPVMAGEESIDKQTGHYIFSVGYSAGPVSERR